MSNNFGQSWNLVTGLPSAYYWSALSTDSGGINMVAAQDYNYGNIIYYSNNSGLTWQSSNFQIGDVIGLCQSASGNIVYAATGGGGFNVGQGYIYNSTDYGKTWQQTPAPLQRWGQIACDSSGQYITATVFAGQVYTSSDYGVAWVPQNISVANSGPSSSSDSSLSGGAIAGIVIGTLIGVALIGVAVAVFVFGWTLPCWSTSSTKSPLLSNAA
jgi:hypothetical protein